MKTPWISFQEFIRRTGNRDRLGEQPQLAEVISPVGIVADWSATVPPILTPEAVGGQLAAITVGNRPAAKLLAMSRGGFHLLYWSFAPTIATNLSYLYRLIPMTLTTPNAIAWHPATQFISPIQTLGETGDVNGNLFAPTFAPAVKVPAGETFVGPQLYIPPGYTFGAFGDVVSNDACWSFVIREITAPFPTNQ